MTATSISPWKKTTAWTCLAGISLLMITATSPAATVLWVGDVDANWATNAAGNSNWDGDTLPASSGDILAFGSAGTSGTTLQNDLTSLSVSGVTFVDGGAGYTLQGNTLTLSGSIQQANTTAAQTIQTGIQLGANSTISATGGGLTLGGLISTDTASLTVGGAQFVNFTGGLNFTNTSNSTSIGVLTLEGADVRFNSAAIFNSDVFVNSGRTKFQSATQTFDNGLKIDGPSTIVDIEGTAQVIVHGRDGSNSGANDSLIISNNATLNVSSATANLNTSTSRFWMQSGTLNISAGAVQTNASLIAQDTAAIAAINVSGGTLTMGGGNRFANNGRATLTVSGTGSVLWTGGGYGLSENGRAAIIMNGGTFTLTANTFHLNGGNSAAVNTSAYTSYIAFNAGLFIAPGFTINTSSNANQRRAELRFNGGTLQVSGSPTVSMPVFIPQSDLLSSLVQAGGAVIDTNTFNSTIADNLEHDAALGSTPDGGVKKNGSGVLTLSGANTYTGKSTANAGGLIFSNNTGNAVTYTGQVEGLGGTVTATGAYQINFTGGFAMTNASSTLTVTGTDVRVSGTSTFAQKLFVNGASTVLTFEGSSSSTILNATGDNSLQLEGGATLRVNAGSVNFNTGRIFTQNGTIQVNGGTLTLQNALIAQLANQTTHVNVTGGELNLGTNVRFSNNGTANLTVSGAGVVNWTAGYGISENGNSLVSVNEGQLNLISSGAIYFNLNGGNQTSGNLDTFYSILSMNGGITATRGFTMNTSSGSNRTAEIRFNGGTLRATDHNSATNFIPDSTKLTSKVQDGGAVVDTNGYNITIADNLEHDTALGTAYDGGLTKQGTGVLTLTHTANTYTGKTTVQTGTLALSGTGSIAASHWLEVQSGAVFSTTAVTGGTYTYDHTISGTGTLQAGAGNTFIVGTDGGTGVIKPGNSSAPDAVGTAGNSIGTLTFTGNLTLTGATTPTLRMELQLGDANATMHNDAIGMSANLATLDSYLLSMVAVYEAESGTHDRISISGGLNLDAGGQIQLTSLGYQLKHGDVLDLLDWASAGTAANLNADGAGASFAISPTGGELLLPTLNAGLNYNLSLFQNYGIIVVVAPEPGRGLLLISALALLAWRRQRRR